MTNNEILQADLLDILFEHRNKLYGAYALRKNYSRRLGLALGAALSIVLFFIMVPFVGEKENTADSRNSNDIVKLTPLVIPADQTPKPEPLRNKPGPSAARGDHQTPTIVDDRLVKEVLPELNAIGDAEISDENEGEKPNDNAGITTSAEPNGLNPASQKDDNTSPALPGKSPSFPGGTEAWLAFLRRYLQSPVDLEPGQRIEVFVRFWVDVDGKVSRPEIIKSGGSSFDQEVLRVLKKMPRWEPALQAGNPVSYPYTQPVIFIGVEQ